MLDYQIFAKNKGEVFQRKVWCTNLPARLWIYINQSVLLSTVSATYSLVPSPCSSAAAVSAPSAVSPAPAPDGGSPSSSGAPAAPAGASMPEALVAAVGIMSAKTYLTEIQRSSA